MSLTQRQRTALQKQQAIVEEQLIQINEKLIVMEQRQILLDQQLALLRERKELQELVLVSLKQALDEKREATQNLKSEQPILSI